MHLPNNFKVEENDKWEEVAEALGMKKKDSKALRAKYMEEFKEASEQSGEDDDEKEEEASVCSLNQE